MWGWFSTQEFMRGVLPVNLPRRCLEFSSENPSGKVTPKVPKGGVQSSCGHAPGCLPHVAADPTGEVGEEEGNGNQTGKRWTIDCQGPAGSMSRV